MEKLANDIKQNLENAILTATFNGKKYDNGQKAKEALIRSQKLINYVHEFVKEQLIENGVDRAQIYPPLGESKPELKLAGFLKQKDQDVCVVPKEIKKTYRKINWGPLAYENVYDEFGKEYTENTLIINIRSQLSSLAKNADTLFERNFAEAMNLHILYPKAVLGEVYLIPLYEYDDDAMKRNQVAFKKNRTNIEKYISFFTTLNNRINKEDELYKYEKVALIIVDFSKEKPKVYNSTIELKADGVVKKDFQLELSEISLDKFSKEILKIYDLRFSRKNICIEEMVTV